MMALEDDELNRHRSSASTPAQSPRRLSSGPATSDNDDDGLGDFIVDERPGSPERNGGEGDGGHGGDGPHRARRKHRHAGRATGGNSAVVSAGAVQAAGRLFGDFGELLDLATGADDADEQGSWTNRSAPSAASAARESCWRTRMRMQCSRHHLGRRSSRMVSSHPTTQQQPTYLSAWCTRSVAWPQSLTTAMRATRRGAAPCSTTRRFGSSSASLDAAAPQAARARSSKMACSR